MRRFILATLLAVCSSGAAAEWVGIGGDDSITFYADPASIRQAGNMVRMWNLVDYKTAQQWRDGKRYMSAKGEQEYDCKEPRTRTLYSFWHAVNMGLGDVIFSDLEVEKWEPVASRSLGEILWKIACGRP